MSRIEKNSLFLTAFFYIFVGASHFFAKDFLVELIPPFIPFKEFLIYASGLLEIVLGTLLLMDKYRSKAAWLIIYMLISYLIVHVYMLVEQERFITMFHLEELSLPTASFFWARLVLQFVFIYWIYAFTDHTKTK